MYNCTLMDKLKQKLNCQRHVYFQGCLIFNISMMDSLEGYVFYKKPPLMQRKQVASSVLVDRHFTVHVINHQISYKLNLYKACNGPKCKFSIHVPRNRHSCGINKLNHYQICSQFSNKQPCFLPQVSTKIFNAISNKGGLGFCVLQCGRLNIRWCK